MSMVEKLAYMKKQRNLTLEEIAALSGVPVSTVNKIFAGQTRSPAPLALDQICQVLGMPIHYFLDDAIPLECGIAVYAESQQFVMISERQRDLLRDYGSLTEPGRMAVDILVDILKDQVPALSANGPVKRLVCYEPVGCGRHGTYGDGFYIKIIDVIVDKIVEQSDFAIRLADDGMEPIHRAGTILGVKYVPVAHNHLGVYLVDREGYVRKYYEHKGVRKLKSVNLTLKDIDLTDQQEVHCLGEVVGAIRNFDWVDNQDTQLLAGR